MDLLFAAEQYAAAQATAVAAAQYYANAANAAMSAAAGHPPAGVALSAPGMLIAPPPPTIGTMSPMIHPMMLTAGPTGPIPIHFSQHPQQHIVPQQMPLQTTEQRFEEIDESPENRQKDRRERDSGERRDRRDRSRSKDRHRRKDRDRERDRGSKRDRSSGRRERSPRRRRTPTPESDDDWKAAPPNNTIMVRGLATHITEQDIQDNINVSGLEPKDIRLIRKKDTGVSRGFAFVEFSTVQEASDWMEAQQGVLEFEGANRAVMQYSLPRDGRAHDTPRILNDWICAKCGVQNFRRREACFKCSGPRTECDVGDSADEISSHPTNSVLLSNLDALTTEDSVLNVVGPLTKLPLKSVRIGKDPLTNTSRGVCYVEMNSVVDAMFLHNQLFANPPTIDGKKIEVAYHKQAGPAVSVVHGQNAAANSALEAAQWSNNSRGKGDHGFTENEIGILAEYSANLYAKNEAERAQYVDYYKDYYRKGGDAGPALQALHREKDSPKPETDEKLGTVTVNGEEYKVYPSPDVSTYQFDETSGYYYDPLSTLYYDANSQYYYNSNTNKFMYWDSKHETFLPAPDKNEENEGEKKPEGKKDKVKTAKRIAKDMEKWAKTLNQRKDAARNNCVVTQETGLAGPGLGAQKGAEDIAFSILQRKDKPGQPGPPEPTGSSSNAGASLAGIAGYGSDSDNEESAGVGSSGGDRHADWEKLACLLCKRQFPSKEKLTKHNQMSNLHKENLEEWKKSRDASGQTNRDRESGIQYRDRAKERRTKYGDDDDPKPNRLKDKYIQAMEQVSQAGTKSEPASKIGEDNVGNKMLQKMGWKSGTGLGKNSDGRTEIIEAQARSKQTGLGTAQPIIDPNDSYREIARKSIYARYQNN